MARVPTEFAPKCVVAGNGPPCTMASDTSTPVGNPLTNRRPAFRSKTGKVALPGRDQFFPSARSP